MRVRKICSTIFFLFAISTIFVIGFNMNLKIKTVGKATNSPPSVRRNISSGANTEEYCKKRRNEFRKRKHEQSEDSKVWNDVEYMLVFIGRGRSGTTLIGALLDAHPNIVMPNEYDIVRKWQIFSKQQKTRDNLFQELYLHAVSDVGTGLRAPQVCHSNDQYTYHVPNQWQGNFNKTIRVIGDKQAIQFNKSLETDPRVTEAMLLNSVQAVVKLPFKYIFVLRNPWDVVATMMFRRRSRGKNTSDRDNSYVNKLQYDTEYQLRMAKEFVYEISVAISFAKRPETEVIVLYSEDIIKHTRKELKRLCKFLTVLCSEDYLKDCSDIVYANPSKTRFTINWNREAYKIIKKFSKKEPLYKRYSFKE